MILSAHASSMLDCSDIRIILRNQHVVDLDMHIWDTNRYTVVIPIYSHVPQDPELQLAARWAAVWPTRDTLVSVSHTNNTYTALACPQKTLHQA